MAFDFVQEVEDLLVDGHMHSVEEAKKLIEMYTNVMTNGMMAGLTYSNVRATAIALETMESKKET